MADDEKLYTDDEMHSAFLAGLTCAYYSDTPGGTDPTLAIEEDEALWAARAKAEKLAGDWRDWMRYLGFGGRDLEKAFAIVEAAEPAKARKAELTRKAIAALPKPGSPRQYPPVPPPTPQKK